MTSTEGRQHGMVSPAETIPQRISCRLLHRSTEPVRCHLRESAEIVLGVNKYLVGMTSFRKYKKQIGRILPNSSRAHVSRAYNYVQARRADRRFSPVALDQNAANDASQHVVCVVVDALRADVIDAETTPFLSSLAGIDAVTPASWTFPAVSSLMTGLYPH